MNSDAKGNFSRSLAITTSLQQFAQTAFQCWGDHSFEYNAPSNWKGWWHTWDGDFSWPWYHYTLCRYQQGTSISDWQDGGFYMSSNSNQSKHYRIYLKSPKEWVEVPKEFYREAMEKTVCAAGRAHGMFHFYGANHTSRFAWNTLDCLKYIRQLKEKLKQITVWEYHFTVKLKSGLKIDIEG